MNPKQALQVLDEATQPQNVGKISREGYIAIQQALVCFSQLIPQDEESVEGKTPESKDV